MKKTQDANANVATNLLNSIHQAANAVTLRLPGKFNATVTDQIIPLGNKLVQELADKPNSLATRAKLKSILSNFTSSAPSLKSNAINGAASRISGQFSAFQMAVEEAEEILNH